MYILSCLHDCFMCNERVVHSMHPIRLQLHSLSVESVVQSVVCMVCCMMDRPSGSGKSHYTTLSTESRA